LLASVFNDVVNLPDRNPKAPMGSAIYRNDLGDGTSAAGYPYRLPGLADILHDRRKVRLELSDLYHRLIADPIRDGKPNLIHGRENLTLLSHRQTKIGA
jgi:hypothetical protein